MKIVILFMMLVLASCSVWKKNHPGLGSTDPLAKDIEAPPAEVVPVPEEIIEPIDTFLSIGAYLQKELDKVDNNGKIFRVFVQMRQDNSLARNLDLLRDRLLPANPTLGEAIESARKQNFSTLEFDVEITSLKESLTTINKAVSGIEISMGSLPSKE